MAKRYIDTELFDDEWFMDLHKDSKILFMYYITKCTHAGLFKINERLCKVQTGITDIKGALEGLRSRLIEVHEGLFFMPKFLFFQYPKFPQSKVYQQRTALDELTKLGLFKDGELAPQEGLSSPYVDVSVNVDVDVKGESEGEKPVIFPFTSEIFKKYWVYWKEYKLKEFRFKYKSHISEQASVKELSNLSNGDEGTALKIIEKSIANGWQGLFPLDKKGQSSNEMNNYLNELQGILND